MRPVLRSWPRCWSAIRLRASPIGRRRDMPRNAAELAQRLARDAEAVCRHYLSNGRRVGNYWQVGDVRNTAGRSMFVRLKDTGGGPAGEIFPAANRGDRGPLHGIPRKFGVFRLPPRTPGTTRVLNLPPPPPPSGR